MLESIAQIPSGLDKAKSNILAYGESSGHCHMIEGAEVLEKNGEIYLTVEQEADLKHVLETSGIWTGEHKDIKIPAGNYILRRQQEYNPYEKAIQQVAD